MAKKKAVSTAKSRIKEFLIGNVGRVVTRDEIQQAAKDPVSGKIPENWHQRLSELRVDDGYDILSWRDRENLAPGQYLLESETPARAAKRRAVLSKVDREALLERDQRTCQWPACGLREGDTDPVGGGTVVLTADHKSPHSGESSNWTGTLDDWQILCARHQQEKKNFIDDRTGRKNVRELVRTAPRSVKLQIREDLAKYFSED